MKKELQISGPIKAIQIIHISILGSALIFGGFVFLLINPNSTLIDLDNLLTYVPTIAAIVLFPMSNILFNKKLQLGKSDVGELRSKFLVFQSAHITRIALIEILAFLSVITSLITNTLGNYILFIIAIVYLIGLYPTSNHVAEKLELSQSERLQLETD